MDAKRTAVGLLFGALVAACGGGDADADAALGPVVGITEPTAGSTYAGGSVRVVLVAEGIEIAPAAAARAGTAHHHLFVDRDVTPIDQPIPTGDSLIIHLGGGESEYTLTGLSAGRHRLIAVLANPAHVPLDPLVADTVEFEVR